MNRKVASLFLVSLAAFFIFLLSNSLVHRTFMLSVWNGKLSVLT